MIRKDLPPEVRAMAGGLEMVERAMGRKPPGLDDRWEALYNKASGERDRLKEINGELLEACIQADLQIEYMQSKFKQTGTGNAVRAQLQAVIAKAQAEGREP